MTRDETLSRLRAHESDFKRLGVESLFLFGSTVRNEATELSDIDLFFDYQKGKLGLFELMDVKSYADQVLGVHVDVMTRDSLHRKLRQVIEESALRVF